MKYCINAFLLLSLLAYASQAQPIPRVENIKITSKSLNQEREIIIYTPIEYDARVHEYFHVIYVFDSQGRQFFDYTTAMLSFLADGDISKAFIVVGITSPYIKDLDYARNNDMLPKLETQASMNRYGKYSGNAENFLKYVSEEVVSFVNGNYRTKGRSMAIGHSLSASFILYSMLKTPNLFDSYVAVSPNLAYDDEKMATALIDFDYQLLEDPTYIYLSHANEGSNYWKEWKPAREKVYAFFNNELNDQNIKFRMAAYPEKNHLNTFPPSVENALNYYFEEVMDKQAIEPVGSAHEVTIRVKVPNMEDKIYITGNQESLGNWNPKKIRMKRVSDFEREITTSLRSLAQFKFTRGSWESEAEVVSSYGNIMIKPEQRKVFEFRIEGYFDR